MVIEIKANSSAEEIRKAFSKFKIGKKPFNAAKHFGKVKRDIDGLDYQKQVRG